MTASHRVRSRREVAARPARSIAKAFVAPLVAAVLVVEGLVSIAAASAREDESVTVALDALEASVQALLESDEVRDRAWGAYYVGKHGLDGLTDDLHPLLLPRSADRSAELVALTAFDSLIRLGAPLTPALLRDLPRQFCHEAVVASLHDPLPLAPELVTLVGDENAPGACQKAVGILLADARTPGFAAARLAEMVCRVHVSVTSPGKDARRQHSLRDLPGYESPRVVEDISVPEGFPPVRRYRLRDTMHRGARLVLTQGDERVWLETIDVSPGLPATYVFQRSVEGDPRERYAILTAWAGVPEDREARTRMLGGFHDVTWSNAAQLRRDVDRIRSAQKAWVRNFAAKLRDSGALTEAEYQAVNPKIIVKLHDARSGRDARTPLPELGAAADADIDAKPDVTIGSVSWYRDYDTARAIAVRRGKPMWLHFGEHPG